LREGSGLAGRAKERGPRGHQPPLLEDFVHLYRYAALMDRLQGNDANVLVQRYSDIVPGRPTAVEHRHRSTISASPTIGKGRRRSQNFMR
jgi:hypothetical protein